MSTAVRTAAPTVQRPIITGKNTMRIMDPVMGDLRVEWDRDNDDEVSAARNTFDKMKAKGFAFFEMEDGGKVGSQIKRFKPKMEQIIGIPPLVGG